MLVGASVLHAWEHRFPSAPWRHLSVHKKLDSLVSPVPFLPSASATRPCDRVLARLARPAAVSSRRNYCGISTESY